MRRRGGGEEVRKHTHPAAHAQPNPVSHAIVHEAVAKGARCEGTREATGAAASASEAATEAEAETEADRQSCASESMRWHKLETSCCDALWLICIAKWSALHGTSHGCLPHIICISSPAVSRSGHLQPQRARCAHAAQ